MDITQGKGAARVGWVEFGQPPRIGKGLIQIMTSYTKTPSVAATVHSLRTRGVGARVLSVDSEGPVAGFRGLRLRRTNNWRKRTQLDSFHAADQPGNSLPRDHFSMDKGEVFRVTVLDIRGKSVVIAEETSVFPADQFPDFLATADALLSSLTRFSG